MLAVLAAAFMSFVGILTETSLNVTFPTMMKQFKVSLDTIQWTTTGYLLTIAIIMICSSYLNQRFTAKQLFLTACLGFIVGSIICALAIVFPVLLLGRLVSALSAGLSIPLMFNLITEIMPREKWGFYMGIAGLVVAMAPTLGPAFGGAVNYYLNWRQIFIIVTILALIVLVAGSFVIGQYHEVKKTSFDWMVFILLALSFISLTCGVNQISHGLANPLLWGLLIATIVLLALFIWQSKRSLRKLLDLQVFKEKIFICGLLAYFSLQFVNIGTSFVLPNYIQIVGHQSSLIGGLILLPGSIIAGLLNPLFGQIYDRVGAKLPLFLGGIMLTLSCLFFTIFGLNLTVMMIIVLYGLLMLGHRMSFSNTLAETLKYQQGHLRADATAFCQTAQQLAGSIGTTIMAAIIAIWQNKAGASYSVLTAEGSQAAFAFNSFLGLLILVSYFCLFNYEKRRKAKN
ncbi:DHA2 family efflux MFS transporter permease subunit [Lactobacillus xujianguonis]|uniref:DHA2 family efflux MFS transporter permease subunit n=1 Tax=Lactobacillus xujianguonis TaxID=2495899 RepID=A0A437SWI6_9LACO|nr:DHA2 family efflux MFS transporter permease subunit [Lactobacillus xujianguonis]RVU71295.1 DHA2 family efflux MFS transporter permease subunit [Lactobacillus xujianguonis]